VADNQTHFDSVGGVLKSIMARPAKPLEQENLEVVQHERDLI